ncbi:MAG: hypothetical protein J2O48_11595, partial [Solirubrobacterales bacterium]|nr:hypothetical protein [Solirubrobacterales bacterium]
DASGPHARSGAGAQAGTHVKLDPGTRRGLSPQHQLHRIEQPGSHKLRLDLSRLGLQLGLDGLRARAPAGHRHHRELSWAPLVAAH